MCIRFLGQPRSPETLTQIIARANVLRAETSNRLEDDPYILRVPLRLHAPEVLAEMDVHQLLLYLCLYGRPADLEAYVLQRLGGSEAAENRLLSALKQGASDARVRKNWYQTLEMFWEAHQQRTNVQSGRSNWPQIALDPERALVSVTGLLLACLQNIEDTDELRGFCFRIENPQVLQRLKPYADELAQRFETHDTMLGLLFRYELMGQAIKAGDFEGLLSRLPESSENELYFWLSRLKHFSPEERFRLILALLEHNRTDVCPGLEAELVELPEELLSILANHWLGRLPAQERDAFLRLPHGWRITLRLLPYMHSDNVWAAVVQALEQIPETADITDSDLAETLLEGWCQWRYAKPLADSGNELALDEARREQWQSLLTTAGKPLRLPFHLLQWPQTRAWASRFLSVKIQEQKRAWSPETRTEGWGKLLAAEGLEPLPLLESLTEAECPDDDKLLAMLWLLAACLARHPQAEVRGVVTAWLQHPPVLAAPSLEPALKMVRTDFGYPVYEQMLLLFTDAYPLLKSDEQRLRLVRQLRKIRDSQVQKMLWSAFRQPDNEELTWVAGLSLAQQGQRQLKPYLESLGHKLYCYDGIAALCGIKETQWATRLAWEMLEGPERFCCADPDGITVPAWLAALDAIQWFDLDRQNPRLHELRIERPECDVRIRKLIYETWR